MAARKGAGGICLRTPAVGVEKEMRQFFLRHEIYKKYVSSAEAEMGMKERIMCVEQCTFYVSPVAFQGPQNALKLLAAGASFHIPTGFTALPRLPS